MTKFWQYENQNNETREDGEKLGKKLAHNFFETLGKGDDNYLNMHDLFVDLIDVCTNNAYLDGQIAGFSKEITKMLAANIFFNGTSEQ